MDLDLIIKNLESKNDKLIIDTVYFIRNSNISDKRILTYLEPLLKFDLYTDMDDNGSGGLPYVVYLDYNYAPLAIAKILKNSEWILTDLEHYIHLIESNQAHPIVVAKIFVELGMETIEILNKALKHSNPNLRKMGLYGIVELRTSNSVFYAKEFFLDPKLQDFSFRAMTRLTLNDSAMNTWDEIKIWVESNKSLIQKQNYKTYMKIIENKNAFESKWIHERTLPTWYGI
ncbi:MAG: hypothetical protein SFU98_12520 [Leptospiraceae bacterium]|nr:hypothetical protein [Leptospiraceae bacterium]